MTIPIADSAAEQQRLLVRLRAKEDIQDALLRYCRGVDRRDFDLMRSAYHPDAIDDHGGYRGDVSGLIRWVEERHRDVAHSMHFLGNCSIELAGDEAVVETYCVVHQRFAGGSAIAPLGFGSNQAGNQMALRCRYIDRFSCRRDEWRIAERVVVYESVSFEHAEEAPFGPGLTVARRDRGDALYAFTGNT
jgi:SnoaL-like protein